MTCPNCSNDNPDTASFCMSCGTSLAVACSSCGTDLPADAKFCFSCGTPVDQAGSGPETDSPPPPASTDDLKRFVPDELLRKLEYAARTGAMSGERRVVTMLFCDVAGSTSAAQHLDPEDWAEVMNGAFDHLIAPVYRYEGTLARLMGDAILAFFGAPIGHEDDAERAVLAGLEILDEIEPYRETVRTRWGVDFDVRVGINTGLVVVGEVGSDLRVEYTAMGDAVNLAARMEQTADAGTVQITGATKALVEQLFEFDEVGPVDVKGKDEPVDAYRVLQAKERPEDLRGIPGLASPMVGRDTEFATLSAISQRLVDTGQGHVVSIIGEAGLGKSRLVRELRASLDTSTLHWFEGRSLSYETATPYAPAIRLLQSMVGIAGPESVAEKWRRLQQTVAQQLPGKTGEVAPFLAWMMNIEPADEFAHRLDYLEAPQIKENAFRAFLALVEAFATSRPTYIVLEDLHWADQSSTDLATELLAVAERAPLVILLLFRPRREGDSWQVHQTAEQHHGHLYTHVRLAPLTEADSRELIGNLLAIDGLDDATRNTILGRSEGNPFFVEEIVRWMIDAGAVTHEAERWVATQTARNFPVPATLSAVLTTRLDALDEASRNVVQAAAVVGRTFRYDELAAALVTLEGLEPALSELQRREIIRQVTRIPKREFTFIHALVQEAAYSTVLLKTRAQMHSAVADFLIDFSTDRATDIADHLVRANQIEKAVPYLVEAGEQASRAYAIPTAIERFETALSAMSDGTEPELVQRALEGLGQAKQFLFDLEGAADAYLRLETEGRARKNDAMVVSAMNKHGFIRGFFLDERQEALQQLVASEEMARSSGEATGLAEACINQCRLRTGWAEFDEVEFYMREVTELGLSSGDDNATLFGMSHLANTLLFLTRYDEALVQAERALEHAEAAGNLQYQAELLTFPIPFCHQRNGDLDAAMAAVERGMEIAQRIGDRGTESVAAVFQGQLAMYRGYLQDALALFRRANAAADATGFPVYMSLARCVTGTCYMKVGGPLAARADELHQETLNFIEMPSGITMAALLWAEIGHCAMGSGKTDRARQLFDRALTEQTAAMYLSRPSALLGECEIALTEGRVDDARRLLDEADAYVHDREMRHLYGAVKLAAARIEMASGNPASGLELLAGLDVELAELGMRRVLLDVYATLYRATAELGREGEARSLRALGENLTADIAKDIADPELRSAFEIGSAEMFDLSQVGAG